MESKAFIDASGKLIVENGRIIYRNFSGVGTQFNREADRNFCVFIDNPETANELKEQGWNVKIRKPRDPEDEVSHYIKVNVSYRFREPKIIRHIGNYAQEMHEDNIKEIDQDDILYCDMVINPSRWERPNGDWGLSAYLQELHVIDQPDYFSSKYGSAYDKGEAPEE